MCLITACLTEWYINLLTYVILVLWSQCTVKNCMFVLFRLILQSLTGILVFIYAVFGISRAQKLHTAPSPLVLYLPNLRPLLFMLVSSLQSTFSQSITLNNVSHNSMESTEECSKRNLHFSGIANLWKMPCSVVILVTQLELYHNKSKVKKASTIGKWTRWKSQM